MSAQAALSQVELTAHQPFSGVRQPHILQILVKNTSTLDYSLPLLRKIRETWPEARVSVLFCVSDKRQILRKGLFFSSFFGNQKIASYDLADFFHPAFRWLMPVWRRLFHQAYSDKASEIGRLKFADEGWMFIVKSPVSFLISSVQFLLGKVETFLGERLIDVESILPRLNADVVLFDNRTITPFYGKKAFFSYLEKTRTPVVLLPHAPHYIEPEELYVPFDPDGEALPDYCDVWVPLQNDRDSKNRPDASQLCQVGYPGFDSDWIRSSMARKTRTSGALRCLIITRKFLPDGAPRPAGCTPFLLDYDVHLQFFNRIGDAAKKCAFPIEFVIKPHPSSSFQMTKDLIQASTLTNATISHEPFYDLIPGVDAVVSFFSTSALLPVFSGVPVIVLDSDLQRFVHSRWDRLKAMYEGLRFFLRETDNLSDAFDTIQNERLSKKPSAEADIRHLRKFYSDGASQRGVERISSLLNKRSAEKP